MEWTKAKEKKDGVWLVECSSCRNASEVCCDKGTVYRNDIPEHLSPFCKRCCLLCKPSGQESARPCDRCNGPLHLHSDEGGIKIFRCKHCYGNLSPPNLIVGYELRSPEARVPTYAHDGDAGADLYAVSFENVAWHEPHSGEPGPLYTHFACETTCHGPGDVCDTVKSGRTCSAPIFLRPSRCVLVHTELSMTLPKGWEASIRGRSGLAFKHGVVILHIGTGDAGFTGKYDVILKNESATPFEIKPGDRIAQVVFAPVGRAAFQQREMPATERGHGGYGSTGVR